MRLPTEANTRQTKSKRGMITSSMPIALYVRMLEVESKYPGRQSADEARCRIIPTLEYRNHSGDAARIEAALEYGRRLVANPMPDGVVIVRHTRSSPGPCWCREHSHWCLRESDEEKNRPGCLILTDFVAEVGNQRADAAVAICLCCYLSRVLDIYAIHQLPPLTRLRFLSSSINLG